MNTYEKITEFLKNLVKKEPNNNKIFFKTGAGDYAEHDQFIGVKVPTLRTLAKQLNDLPLQEIATLMRSAINEERLLALFLLTDRYKRANTDHEKEQYYNFYLKNLNYVSNWNLVDSSAHLIIGAHLDKNLSKQELLDADKNILLSLAESKNMWDRRIAIVATWHFIRINQHELTLTIAKKLIKDKHDLIHKAVGWMLREMGKKDKNSLILFLQEHAGSMPRTMLRYALEKFTIQERSFYMNMPKKTSQ